MTFLGKTWISNGPMRCRLPEWEEGVKSEIIRSLPDGAGGPKVSVFCDLLVASIEISKSALSAEQLTAIAWRLPPHPGAVPVVIDAESLMQVQALMVVVLSFRGQPVERRVLLLDAAWHEEEAGGFEIYVRDPSDNAEAFQAQEVPILLYRFLVLGDTRPTLYYWTASDEVGAGSAYVCSEF